MRHGARLPQTPTRFRRPRPADCPPGVSTLDRSVARPVPDHAPRKDTQAYARVAVRIPLSHRTVPVSRVGWGCRATATKIPDRANAPTCVYKKLRHPEENADNDDSAHSRLPD